MGCFNFIFCTGPTRKIESTAADHLNMEEAKPGNMS
jgi:hypothetical protein